MAWLSNISKDFLINAKDRPDGMKSSDTIVIKDDEILYPEGFSRGYVERNLEHNPVGSLYGATSTEEFNTDIPLIPWEEFPERIKEQETKNLRLSDIRMIGNYGNPIPSLDQNGQGFCWAYSTCHAIMLLRAFQNMPYVRLSGHSLACKIMNHKDEGGWSPLSASEACKFGYMPTSIWTEKSMSRSFDTEENWEIAKNFRITEGFLDLDKRVYDMNLTFQQIASCLLSGIPCTVDYDWWGHSILAMDLVYVSDKYPPTDIRCYALRIWNSWRDSWGNLGTGLILGKKAIPMGSVAVRNVAYCDKTEFKLAA